MDGLVTLAPLAFFSAVLTLAGLPLVAYGLGWAAGMMVRRDHFGLFGNLLTGFLGIAIAVLLDSMLGGLAFVYDLPALHAGFFFPVFLAIGPLIVAWPLRRRRGA